MGAQGWNPAHEICHGNPRGVRAGRALLAGVDELLTRPLGVRNLAIHQESRLETQPKGVFAMNRLMTIAAVCASLHLSTNRAAAEETLDEWSFDITPRFWYMMVNPTAFSDSTVFQQTNETGMFPMYGLSLRVEPPNFSGSDFLLTGFHGSDTVHGRSVFAAGVSAGHQTKATRTDIELLFRTQVPESNVHWFVGPRWVLFAEESDIGSGLTFPASATSHLSEETTFYLAEMGASFSTPIDPAGRHAFFGNFTGGLGYEAQEVTNRGSTDRPDKAGVIPFIDVNFSYQYVFAENASFHARYRSFVLHEVVREEVMVLHGPEIDITINF